MGFYLKWLAAVVLVSALILGLLAVGLAADMRVLSGTATEQSAGQAAQALAVALAGRGEDGLAAAAESLSRTHPADLHDGPIEALAQRALRWAALALVLVAVLSLLVAHAIARSFRRLSDAAEQVHRNGPGPMLPERGHGPLAQASAAFNLIIRELADADAELREALKECRALAAQVRAGDVQRRHLIDTCPDAIVGIDEHGLIRDFNPAASRLFDVRRDAAAGQPLDRCLEGFITEDAGPPSCLLFQGTDEAPALGCRRQLVLSCRQGARLQLEVLVTEMPGGATGSLIAFLRDIGEREHYRRMLEDAERRAEQAGAAKSRFLASMSHEIRTPLNAILNMNDLLLETDLGQEQRGYATTANEAARSLLSIVNGVLDFSKLEAGRLEPTPEVCDPEEVLRSVVDLLAARAYAKGIQLTTFTAPVVPAKLKMDPGLVRQILLNLIGNAIKFTDSGGVRVRLDVLSDAAGADPADADSLWLSLQVIDTGIGIPEAEQPNLFDEFVQADSSGDRRSSGSGLGLAISRRLARLLGGDIRLLSQQGEGSRFELSLPVVMEPDAVPRGDAAQALHRLSVTLVVEDALVAADLRAQLEAFGVEVALEPTLARAGLPEACCGELRLRRVAAGAGGQVGEKRLLRLYQLGSHCAQPAGQPVPMLRLPAVSSQLVSALNAAIEGRAVIDEAVPKDDLMDRLRQVSATAKTILLVDDSHANQLVATTLLANAGLRIDVAENGLQAVAAVNRGDYGLVLMDLAMPEMDGLEATGCIRDMPGKRGRVPIVAMTANVFAEDRQRCFDAGMDDFLIKPIERGSLYKAVLHWLGGLASHRGLPAAAAGRPEAPRAARGGAQVAPGLAAAAASAADPATDGAVDDADSDGAPPVLDLPAIEELEAGLSAQLMPTVIATYIDEVQQRVAEVERLSADGDASAVGDEGHGLKGSAATFGTAALRALAQEIEFAGRAGDLEGVRRRLGLLRARSGAAISALKARYPQPES